MREIKFRAWNKNSSTMIDLYKITPLAINIPQDGLFIPFGDDIELMQFTGLLDKNGKEIYEGDILSGHLSLGDPNFADDKTANVVVVWFQSNVEYILVDIDEYVRNVRDEPSYMSIDEPWTKREVIGNIYENKDLLK